MNVIQNSAYQSMVIHMKKRLPRLYKNPIGLGEVVYDYLEKQLYCDWLENLWSLLSWFSINASSNMIPEHQFQGMRIQVYLLHQV